MTTTTKKNAIPVVQDLGMDSTLSPHFARAPMHAVLDTDDCTIQILPTPPGDSGMERIPLAEMKAIGVQTVICRRIGRHAHDYLKANEINVMITTAKDVRGAVMEMDSGKLTPPTDEILDHEGVMKHGHGHCHGEEHGGHCHHNADGKRCCETGEGPNHHAGHGCCHRHGHAHNCRHNPE